MDERTHLPLGLPVDQAHYRIVRRAGSGMTGEVYLAQDLRLAREVAIKVLSASQDVSDSQDLQRFAREAKLLLAHPHPALVPIYDLELDHVPPYLVLGWMAGGDLTEAIHRDGPATAEAVAHLGIRLASALGHLHHHGVIHRDVKPANVLLDGRGEAYLADLGLARVDGAEFTATGCIVGTPRYMAPELFQTGQYTPQSDFFALGTLLLEVTIGGGFEQLADREESVQSGLDAVPQPGLRAVLRGCLRTDASQRFADAAALVAAFEGVLDTATPSADVPASEAAPLTGPYPPLTPQRASLKAYLALAFLCCVALAYLSRKSADRPPVTPARAPTPEVEVHPLAGIGPELTRGLDVLLEQRFSRDGAPLDDADGATFFDSYWRHGGRLLDNLTGEERFFRWLATGGRPERLPPDIRDALLAHDRSLADLGLPATFHPFVAVSPLSMPTPPPPDLLQYPCLKGETRRRLREPSKGWTGQAIRALSDALQAYEETWAKLASKHPGWVQAYVPLSKSRRPITESRPLNEFVSTARFNQPNLAALTAAFETGREHYRRFLYTTLRAVEAREESSSLGLELFMQLDNTLEVFLEGSPLGGTPLRNFGPMPDEYEGLLIYARLVRNLRIMGEISVLPSANLFDLEIRCWRRVIELEGDAVLDHERALAWERLCQAYSAQGKSAELLEVYDESHARFTPLLSKSVRRRLDEVIAQARAP